MATTTPLTADAATIALYHFDGTVGSAGKKDNAEGTASRDLTEGGTLSANDGVITPTSNGGYLLNDFDTYLQTADDAAFDGLSAFTLEIWVNPSSTADDRQPVTKWGATTATDQSWRMITASSKFTLAIGNGSTNGSIVPSSTFSTSTWYYVAFTYDASQASGSRGKVYINGDDVTSSDATPSSMLAGSATLLFGNRNGFPVGGYFAGVIDEVRISNTARSATEIYNYYNDITPSATSRLTLLGVS